MAWGGGDTVVATAPLGKRTVRSGSVCVCNKSAESVVVMGRGVRGMVRVRWGIGVRERRGVAECGQTMGSGESFALKKRCLVVVVVVVRRGGLKSTGKAYD